MPDDRSGFDPSEVAQLARRALGAAQVQAAEGFASFIKSAPEERLERLMRSPARRVLLGIIFRQMPRQLDRAQAARTSTFVRWRITGGPDGRDDVYEVEVANGSATVRRGESQREPRATLTVDGVEFLRLVTRNSEPMTAYFSGRLSISGDVMHASKLAVLFKPPGSEE